MIKKLSKKQKNNNVDDNINVNFIFISFEKAS